jgi:hypothetical protein
MLSSTEFNGYPTISSAILSTLHLINGHIIFCNRTNLLVSLVLAIDLQVRCDALSSVMMPSIACRWRWRSMANLTKAHARLCSAHVGAADMLFSRHMTKEN